MKKQSILIIIFILLLFYPLYSIFQLEEVLDITSGIEMAEAKLRDLQRTIWLSWLVMAALAVYLKWSRKKNLLFYLTYGFLFAAFVVFGIYVQKLVNTFDVPTNFEDSYTLGVFSAFQNIIVSGVLTGFLHAAVWWFTRRWHRR